MGLSCVFCSVFQLFGCGSVAQTMLSKGALGEPLTIHIGFTLGVMMAVYVAGGVSGTRQSLDAIILNSTQYLFQLTFMKQ